MAKVAIVTVLYNSEKVIEDFMISLNLQTFQDFILVVVNNNSPDKSLALVKGMMPRINYNVLIVDLHSNTGVATGNNEGIRIALHNKCDYVLLSNNDIVLENDAIEILLRHMDNNVSMAVPKIINYFTSRIWAAGGEFLKFRGVTRHLGSNSSPSEYNLNRYVNYAPTCFMMIKAEVFSRVGCMDDKYFVYFDDTDFVWRATMVKNENLLYVANSIIYHKESSCTDGELSDFSLYYRSRNAVYFARKFLKKYFILIILYRVFHYFFKLKRVLNKHQLAIVRKAYKDGFAITCETIK